MKKSLFRIFAAVLLFYSSFATAQVSVSPLTGSASVAIPIYPIQRGSINFPINLVYSGSGVRPMDVEGTAGIGWQVQAGGKISRQVRGLPDDIHLDNFNHSRKGWMYNTNQSKIASFSIANTGVANCTSEANDYGYISTHLADSSDLEPDMFYVDAPGLSCQMVFNQSTHTFQPITYQDLVITYTLATDSTLNSFTIVNDAGTKYLFSVPDTAYKRNIASGAVNFNKNEYNLYRNGINYKSGWNLTSITDVNSKQVAIQYTSAPARGGNDTLKLYVGGSTTATIPFITYSSVVPEMITRVYVADDEDVPNSWLTFTYATNPLTGASYYTSISGRGRSLGLSYSDVRYGIHDRMFLRSFAELGCNSPISYTFAYAAETSVGFGNYTTLLPDTATSHQDVWGYYTNKDNSGTLRGYIYNDPDSAQFQRYHIHTSTPNGNYLWSFPGADRSVDTAVIYYGSLIKVTNATGGTSTITYESNDYYDPTYGSVQLGSGIRVKKIVDYDGMSTANNITRNYSYLKPGGVSSGKPVSLPQYAFSIPYSGTATGLSLWVAASAISAYDLSPEDHTVMYEYFKESKTGAGSTQYQYYVPATNFDNSAAPDCNGCTTEWSPTVDLSARPTCVSYGIIASSSASYPFIPNPNYDFERGLPKKITTYNNAPTPVEVSETSYTYNRLATPSVITAFKYEDMVSGTLTARGYGKYLVYYNTGELTVQQTSKVFDSQNLTQSRPTTTTYTYGSTYHKLKTQQVTNSDGSVLTTNYSYLKDYTLAAGTNTNVTALYNLGLLNINTPVETYTTVQKGAGAALTTQASLTLFDKFIFNTKTNYRPSQLLSVVQPGGITFAPLTITGQTLTHDANYFATANFKAYDGSGMLETSDDANNNVTSQLHDDITNQPVAVFKNAAANEVFFQDYDSDVEISILNYSQGGTALGVTTDRNGNSARTFTTGQSIIYSLTKNTQASNYIFSAWLNTTNSGTVTITLTPTTGTTAVYTLPFTLTTGWKYFELPKKSVAGMTSTFTITITTSAMVSIDDILFYPENAEVATFAYDPMKFVKLSETNTNGISAYYKYDTWNRLLYQFDQDKNIVLKNTYVTTANVQDFSPLIGVSPSSGITTATPVSFSPSGAGDICTVAANTYTWNFGDGSPIVTTTSSHAVTHTYPTANTYTVTLTVTSDYFPPKTVTQAVTVTVPPPTNVPLQFQNFATSQAGLSQVQFFQGGVLQYTFSSSQINTATVPSGVYTIHVITTSLSAPYNPATFTGYASVSLVGTSATLCDNATVSGSVTYIFTADLTGCPKLFINFNQAACSGGGGVQ